MHRRSFIKLVAIIALFVGCLCLVRADVAYAKVFEPDKVHKLSIMRGVMKCYEAHAKSSMRVGEFLNFTSIFDRGWESGDKIYVPTEVGNKNKNTKPITCETVFNGKDNVKGFKNYYTLPSNLSESGYKLDQKGANTGNDGDGLHEFTISLGDINPTSMSGNANIKITKSSSSIKCNVNREGNKAYFVGCSGTIKVEYGGETIYLYKVNGDSVEEYYTMYGTSYDVGNRMLYGQNFGEDSFWTIKSGQGLEEATRDRGILYNDLKETITYNINRFYGADEYAPDNVKDYADVKMSCAMYTPENFDEVWVPNGGTSIAPNVMMTGVKEGFDTALPYDSYDNASGKYKRYKWADSAVYSLYYHYLKNITDQYNKDHGSTTISLGSCGSEKPSGYAFKNSSTEWCAIGIHNSYLAAVEGEEVTVVSGSDLVPGTFKTVLDWLKNDANYTHLSSNQYADGTVDSDGNLTPAPGGDDTVDPGEEGEVEPTCANSGGAGSLGWILCPVLDRLVESSKDMYDKYVEPALQINPVLLDESGSGKNTHDSWRIFRDMANILFVILFLVVIFSQLTGVGIDNYGIKKILPKLVIVAILMNLSYYICEICVDLSNIFGNGLRAILDGMASQIDISGVSTPNGSGFAPTAITSVAILGAIGIGVVAVWANPAILLTVLVGALGVFIAIIFLFLLLSARQAAVLILTVVSPIAFACYMLPNTKKLFDKWLKIGEGLLLVYPICGLLVGGGNFASKLLLTVSGASEETNGFFPMLSAMLVGIVPIFFIPSVLKGAFAAMGSLGAKISGFGDKIRGGTTKAIRHTDAYKNAQRMGAERKAQVRNRWKSGTDKNGVLTKRGERKAAFAKTKMGRFLGADKRQARYLAAANKDVATREEANAALTNALSKSEIAKYEEGAKGYYSDEFNKAAAKGDIGGMNAALAAASSSGYMLDKEIAQMVRDALKSANFKDDASRAAWMRNTASKYGNGFLAKDFEMKHWMRKGGAGALGDYGDYARRNIKRDEFSAEDIAKMSGSSLAAMASAGLISSGMARQVLSSGAGLKEDKKIMLNALANGAQVNPSARRNMGDSTEFNDDSNGVKTFKDEVDRALNNEAADAMIGGQTFTGAQRRSWTAPRPMEVRIAPQEGGGAPAVPAAQNGIAQEGQSFDVHGGNGGGADPAWNNYNVTPEMRDELISQGFTPGDTEIDQYRRK